MAVAHYQRALNTLREASITGGPAVETLRAALADADDAWRFEPVGSADFATCDYLRVTYNRAYSGDGGAASRVFEIRRVRGVDLARTADELNPVKKALDRAQHLQRVPGAEHWGVNRPMVEEMDERDLLLFQRAVDFLSSNGPPDGGQA